MLFLRLLALSGLLICVTASADDLYLVQGLAVGPQPARNRTLLWTTDAYLYNAASSEARITLLHVSNSTAADYPRGDTLTLLPHTSRSLLAAKPRWRAGGDPLLVLHLDAPRQVFAETPLFIGDQYLEGPPATFRYTFGKARLPVFRSLVAPGQEQIHLDTSLGPSSNDGAGSLQVPGHLNVAIYNASIDLPATATIVVRQHCDDREVTSRTVSIPRDSIVQVLGFDTRTMDCPAFTSSGDAQRAVYTVVTVDQPSFSFVSVLSNQLPPTATISITP